MTALTRLRLKDFRNYETLALDLDGRHVCLFGANGAGKTNLLEAISQLGPGRGLRSAKLTELTRHGAPDGWTVSATLDDRRIGVGLETEGTGAKRVIRLDGAPAQVGVDKASSFVQIVVFLRVLHDLGPERKHRRRV